MWRLCIKKNSYICPVNKKNDTMKKILLLSALAVAGLSASAQVAFTDVFKVTYEGKVLKSGDEIAVNNLNEAMGQYEGDIVVTLVADAPGAITYVGTYGNDPTFETAEADRIAWGTPAICHAQKDPAGNAGACIPGHDAFWADYQVPLAITTKDEATSHVELQFHLQGYIDFENRKTIPASKVGKYTLVINGQSDAVKIGEGAAAKWEGEPTEDFVVYVVAGPDAKVDGVEGVAVDEANAPAEYFDFTGRRVINPAKGQMVIVRKGSKVSKMIVG